MSLTAIASFESKIENISEINAEWKSLKPALIAGKVDSRSEAHCVFSRALKISNRVAKDEEIKEIWETVLENSSFYLKESNTTYGFKTLLDLSLDRKDAFELSWVDFNCKTDNLVGIAERINEIIEDCMGGGPGDNLIRILGSPLLFGMIAEANKKSVACVYGSYLESLQLFHINFLGRNICYPGVHIIEQLYKQLPIFLKTLANVKCVTFCVPTSNVRNQTLYEKLGFKKIEYVEGHPKKYFYGIKLDNSAILPSYENFRATHDAVRF